MVDIDSREDRNKLRSIVMKAEQNKAIGKEEAGFIYVLVDRFRQDIEKKIRQMHILQGELAQLKNNEQIIMTVLENIISAAERDKARQETLAKMRGYRDMSIIEDNVTEEVIEAPDSSLESN